MELVAHIDPPGDDLSPAPGIGALFEDIDPDNRESLRLMFAGVRS